MSERHPDNAQHKYAVYQNGSALRLVLGILCATSCAAAPIATIPGTGAVFGLVSLVPREGVTPSSGGSAAYNSPALRDVHFVDYSRPGFAVVFVEGLAAPHDNVRIAIQDSRHVARLEPRDTVVGQAGSIEIVNETARVQAISSPVSAALYRLEPGESVEISEPAAGLHSLYLLESAEVTARVFVAPGPYAVVSSRGKFRLDGLPPGEARIHAWHPYFPETEKRIEVPPDGAVRLDFELGVIVDGG